MLYGKGRRMEKKEPIDGICVRLVNSDSDELIDTYTTTRLADTLAMYRFVMDNDISIEVRDENLNVTEYYINDISIFFGNGDNLLSINIYCN